MATTVGSISRRCANAEGRSNRQPRQRGHCFPEQRKLFLRRRWLQVFPKLRLVRWQHLFQPRDHCWHRHRFHQTVQAMATMPVRSRRIAAVGARNGIAHRTYRCRRVSVANLFTRSRSCGMHEPDGAPGGSSHGRSGAPIRPVRPARVLVLSASRPRWAPVRTGP